MKRIESAEDYRSRIKRVLITEEEIGERLAEAGAFIDSVYDGRPIMLVGILKGSFVFLADLCRSVSVPCEISFMAAKSYYEGTESSGEVTVTYELDRDVSGYHLILVEDIVDTGRTLRQVTARMKERKPLSLHVMTLLDKPCRRVVEFTPDMSLFTIEDSFVIGYGLDCGEYYRGLPYIAEYGE